MTASGGSLADLSYDDYVRSSAAPEIVVAIDSITSFTYLARTSYSGEWSRECARRFAFRVRQLLREAVQLSGFHVTTQLLVAHTNDAVQFTYEDEEYGFSFSFYRTGEIILRCNGMSSRLFHEWYRRFMPSAASLVFGTINLAEQELLELGDYDSKEQYALAKKRPPILEVERAAYTFVAQVDVSKDGRAARTLSEGARLVLDGGGSWKQEVTAGVAQSDTASLYASEVYERHEFDLAEGVLATFRVRSQEGHSRRRLTFTFDYIGEPYVPLEGERVPFSASNFVTLNRTEAAYLEFFRNRSICGFVGGLLRDSGEIEKLRNSPTVSDFVGQPR